MDCYGPVFFFQGFEQRVEGWYQLRMYCEASFHKQHDLVNDLPERTDIKLGNQQLSVSSIQHQVKCLCKSNLKVYEHKKADC